MNLHPAEATYQATVALRYAGFVERDPVKSETFSSLAGALGSGGLRIVTAKRLAALEKVAEKVRDDPNIPNSRVRQALAELDALNGD